MGGRGSASGIKANTGFQYKMGNKTITMQLTSTGVVLVNGVPKQMSKQSFEKIYNSQKNKSGFKTLTKAELEKKRKKKYEDYNSHDYELIQTGKQRGKVYRPRKRK